MPTDVMVEGFKYEELSDEAKYRAKDRTGWEDEHRDMCVVSMQNQSYEALGGLTSWELCYSIGFCQGDGVGFKGTMDATDIPDPKWVGTILPMLGAHRVKATVGGHEVSWPRPILEARLELDPGHGSCPAFGRGDLEVTFVCADEDEDGFSEITVNHYVAREPEGEEGAVEIWAAMADYFEELSRRLYRNCTDEILEGWDEGFIEECEEWERLFDAEGNVIQEETP